MKVLKDLIRKNRESIWFSMGVNAGILVLLLYFFRPIYETNDDMGICNLVNGVKGAHDAHLVYSNYILGVILSLLYRIYQSAPWYALLQYGALFCAFTSVLYVLQNRLKSDCSLWITLPMLIFFSYEGYIKLQYTKTAGIVSAAGFFLLFFGLSQETLSWKRILPGYLITGLGFLYREDQFWAEAAMISGIGVILLLDFADLKKRLWGRRILRYLSGAAGLAALIVTLHMIDSNAYREPEWQEYLAYNEARTELFDYGFPNYSKNEEGYQALGIDRTAYQLYRSWNHMDSEKFTVETMRQLIRMKEQKAFDKTVVDEFFEEFPLGFTEITSFFMCVIYCVFALAWGRKKKRDAAAVVYEIGMILALYLYLFYRGRYLYNRVDVGIWFAAVLVLTWLLESEKTYFSGRVGLVLVLSLLCLCQNTWKKNWRENTQKNAANMAAEKAVIEAIHNDQEHLYLLKVGTVSFANAYAVFDRIPFGMGSNIYPLGGWSAKTPTYSRVMEQYGVSNPFRDMIGNEKVYLIDDKIESTLNYLRTYYSDDVQAEAVNTFGKYTIYQISGQTK